MRREKREQERIKRDQELLKIANRSRSNSPAPSPSTSPRPSRESLMYVPVAASSSESDESESEEDLPQPQKNPPRLALVVPQLQFSKEARRKSQDQMVPASKASPSDFAPAHPMQRKGSLELASSSGRKTSLEAPPPVRMQRGKSFTSTAPPPMMVADETKSKRKELTRSISQRLQKITKPQSSDLLSDTNISSASWLVSPREFNTPRNLSPRKTPRGGQRPHLASSGGNVPMSQAKVLQTDLFYMSF